MKIIRFTYFIFLILIENIIYCLFTDNLDKFKNGDSVNFLSFKESTSNIRMENYGINPTIPRELLIKTLAPVIIKRNVRRFKPIDSKSIAELKKELEQKSKHKLQEILETQNKTNIENNQTNSNLTHNNRTDSSVESATFKTDSHNQPTQNIMSQPAEAKDNNFQNHATETTNTIPDQKTSSHSNGVLINKEQQLNISNTRTQRRNTPLKNIISSKREEDENFSKKEKSIENDKQNIQLDNHSKLVQEKSKLLNKEKHSDYKQHEVKKEAATPEVVKQNKATPQEVKKDDSKPQEVKKDDSKPQEFKKEASTPEVVKNESMPSEVKIEGSKPKEVKKSGSMPQEFKKNNTPEEIRKVDSKPKIEKDVDTKKLPPLNKEEIKPLPHENTTSQQRKITNHSAQQQTSSQIKPDPSMKDKNLKPHEKEEVKQITKIIKIKRIRKKKPNKHDQNLNSMKKTDHMLQNQTNSTDSSNTTNPINHNSHSESSKFNVKTKVLGQISNKINKKITEIKSNQIPQIQTKSKIDKSDSYVKNAPHEIIEKISTQTIVPTKMSNIHPQINNYKIVNNIPSSSEIQKQQIFKNPQLTKQSDFRKEYVTSELNLSHDNLNYVRKITPAKNDKILRSQQQIEHTNSLKNTITPNKFLDTINSSNHYKRFSLKSRRNKNIKFYKSNFCSPMRSDECQKRCSMRGGMSMCLRHARVSYVTRSGVPINKIKQMVCICNDKINQYNLIV
jgi:hypothetical protein